MYYFIVNPNSCCGRGKIIWEKLERTLKDSGVEYQAYITEQPGDAKIFAKKNNGRL